MPRCAFLLLAAVTCLGPLPGEEAPTDLGRTSLAFVRASSVNGGRGQGNPYHGVVNAFDGGSHVLRGINYSDWSPDPEPGAWVEVCFDVPVTVHRIIVTMSGERAVPSVLRAADAPPTGPDEGKPADPSGRKGPVPFQAILSAPGGKELHRAESDGKALAFRDPLAGVGQVRLVFDGYNLSVSEIRIEGKVPEGTDFTVGNPRFPYEGRDAEEYARIAFEDWLQGVRDGVTLHRDSGPEGETVVFCSQGGTPLLRVLVGRPALRVLRSEPLLLPPAPARTSPEKP